MFLSDFQGDCYSQELLLRISYTAPCYLGFCCMYFIIRELVVSVTLLRELTGIFFCLCILFRFYLCQIYPSFGSYFARIPTGGLSRWVKVLKPCHLFLRHRLFFYFYEFICDGFTLRSGKWETSWACIKFPKESELSRDWRWLRERIRRRFTSTGKLHVTILFYQRFYGL